MRLFFAIKTPQAIRERLAEVQRDLSRALDDTGIKYRKENLSNSHCTIRFLGEVSEQKMEPMVQHLKESFDRDPLNTFDIRASRIGVFSNFRRARVLWAGLEPENILAALQNKVDVSVKASSILLEEESKPFHPHLSLIRFKDQVSLPQFIQEKIGAYQGSFGGGRVSELILFKSMLSSEGAIHTELSRFEFR